MLHKSGLSPGFRCKACVLTTRALGLCCFTLARFTLQDVARVRIFVGVPTSFVGVASRHTLGPSLLAALLSGNAGQGRLPAFSGVRLLTGSAETAALGWRGVCGADAAASSCAALRGPAGSAAACIAAVHGISSASSGSSSASARGQVVYCFG